MATSVRDEAVETLARQAVAAVSPAELPLFSASVTRYRADPQAALRGGQAGDRALGFGVEAAVVLVTPFALDLVKRMLTRLAEKLGDSAADSVAGRIVRWFSGDGDEGGQDRVELLTPEQLAAVAEATRTEAASLALPADQSERLADAVVAALATRA
jgi:hypothetical protein